MSEKKISIITVSFNSGQTIEETIKSVVNQTAFDEIEYVIVDGGSSDNTIEIVKRYSSYIRVFVSEPDRGIYDAMNKGVELSSGEYIAFLNSDDVYSNYQVIENVLEAFAQSHKSFVYGGVRMIDDNSNLKRIWLPSRKCQYSVMDEQIPHPAFFVKREVFKKVFPYFDSTYEIAADLKQQLIIVDRFLFQGYSLNEILVDMLIGGKSTVSPRAFLMGWRESVRAYNEVFGSGGAVFLYRKLYRKISYKLRTFTSDWSRI